MLPFFAFLHPGETIDSVIIQFHQVQLLENMVHVTFQILSIIMPDQSHCYFLGYPLLKFPSSFLLAVNIFRLKEGGEVVTFLNFNFRQVSFDGGGLGGHLGHHLVFT